MVGIDIASDLAEGIGVEVLGLDGVDVAGIAGDVGLSLFLFDWLGVIIDFVWDMAELVVGYPV